MQGFGAASKKTSGRIGPQTTNHRRPYTTNPHRRQTLQIGQRPQTLGGFAAKNVAGGGAQTPLGLRLQMPAGAPPQTPFGKRSGEEPQRGSGGGNPSYIFAAKAPGVWGRAPPSILRPAPPPPSDYATADALAEELCDMEQNTT